MNKPRPFFVQLPSGSLAHRYGQPREFFGLAKARAFAVAHGGTVGRWHVRAAKFAPHVDTRRPFSSAYALCAPTP